MARRDRSPILAFVSFWVLIAAACLIGLLIAQALGTGKKPLLAAGTHTEARIQHPWRATKPHASQLSLAAIFGPTAAKLKSYNPRKLRTLIATGDVIPARAVNYAMVSRNDFLYPFRPTAAYLRSADLTLINLESPLLTGCPPTVQGMSFCGDPRVTHGLNYAGVDIACTANNHIGNYGTPAISETWQHLTAAGIDHCGLGSIVYRNVRGLRFAFLAYNAVSQRFDYAQARREIRLAKRHADIVVVSVHWGKEYVPVPEVAPGIADDNPRTIAHAVVDDGANLVIGNHPHHVQGVELYHGQFITYAHGNFAFDQMFTVADCPGDANSFCTTREGVVGKYTFYGKKLVSVRFKPVVIYNYAQPRWAAAGVASAILAEMKRSTVHLSRSK